jgi:hypothetical protein
LFDQHLIYNCLGADVLKIGDAEIDSKKILYISSLNAVVVSQLASGFKLSHFDDFEKSLKPLIQFIETKSAESLIIIGAQMPIEFWKVLVGNLPKKISLQVVGNAETKKVYDKYKELLGFLHEFQGEYHEELLWGRYRFLELGSNEVQQNDFLGNFLEFQFQTIVGGVGFGVSLGTGFFAKPFVGYELPVFLKGVGKILLASYSERTPLKSIKRKGLNRFDVFGVGHQRILPMGKVQDLKVMPGSLGRVLHRVPLSKKSFKKISPTVIENSLELD